MSDLKVTSLESLREYAKGQIVSLPPFGENQPFVARLARPSLLDMVADGTIPNPLISSANKLFARGSGSINDEDVGEMKQFTELLNVITKKALIEPSVEQLEEIGLKLTDEQKTAIMLYVQNGALALAPFRGKRKGTKSNSTSKNIQ